MIPSAIVSNLQPSRHSDRFRVRVDGFFVGVSAFQPDFSELLEKLGIEFKSSATGRYKEQGMPFGGGEEGFMEEQLEEVNEIFAESVAEARDLDEAGEVFEGKP